MAQQKQVAKTTNTKYTDSNKEPPSARTFFKGKRGTGRDDPPPPSPSPSPSQQQHVPQPPITPQNRENMESPEETRRGGREPQGEVTGHSRLRLPKMVHSAEEGSGKDNRERIIVVVRSPCQKNLQILQMHTPACTGQCLSRQTQHGLQVCIWMHLLNGMGNSPSLRHPTPE